MKDCKLCGAQTEDIFFELETMVIDMIRKENPEWVEADGVCKRCIEHYKGLDDAFEILDS